MIPISKPSIGQEEKDAVMSVLESGMLAQGKQTGQFEQRFAELCGVRQAIATSSGTTALHIALLAHDIGPGDEVITTPFTFIASVNSILYAGARPVFIDIDEATFNMNPELLEQAVTSRTKAILPVHLYGQVCEMDSLQQIADKYDLTIIEDACQAVGATYKNKKAGSFGTGAFSLYATKNITSAEGGMITTNDDAIADRCRLLRNHGMRNRYQYEQLGYNYRMTDIQAAIGLAQLGRFDELTDRRRHNATFFNERIDTVITPQEQIDCDHVWHQYTVRVNGRLNRDEVNTSLNEAGIGTGIFYPNPAYRYDHIRQVVGGLHLPVVERLSQEVLCLPVHPLLSEEDLATIVDAVNSL